MRRLIIGGLVGCAFFVALSGAFILWFWLYAPSLFVTRDLANVITNSSDVGQLRQVAQNLVKLNDSFAQEVGRLVWAAALVAFGSSVAAAFIFIALLRRLSRLHGDGAL
jgi:tellurite resistance protein TehA-like permease